MTDISKSYVPVTHIASDLFHFKLTTEKYDGIIYNYGTIRFVDDEGENGDGHLVFDYEVKSIPAELGIDDEETLKADTEFTDLIGKILTHIIEESVMKYQETRETTTTNDDDDKE